MDVLFVILGIEFPGIRRGHLAQDYRNSFYGIVQHDNSRMIRMILFLTIPTNYPTKQILKGVSPLNKRGEMHSCRRYSANIQIRKVEIV
ncbi:hypothetical protein AAC387_Pa03g1562 [Persea americana]